MSDTQQCWSSNFVVQLSCATKLPVQLSGFYRQAVAMLLTKLTWVRCVGFRYCRVVSSAVYVTTSAFRPVLELLKKITGGGEGWPDHTRPKSCESTTCYDQHQWTNSPSPLLSSTELLWQALWAHEMLRDTTITHYFCWVRCNFLYISLNHCSKCGAKYAKAKYRVVSDSWRRPSQGPPCRNHHL